MPAEIRALTVRPPWSAFIASIVKSVENRTWATKYRGLLAIHAGVTGDRSGFAHPAATGAVRLAALPWINVRGAVVAVARIDDCHPREAGCCVSPWAERTDGVWHWQLADIRPLFSPIAAVGRLGLWIPSPELTEQINAQMGAE